MAILPSLAVAVPAAPAHSSLSPAGHRLRVRGRTSPALFRQPLHERPHLLQFMEAEGPAQVRGRGGSRGGAAPAHGGHHAERRVRARWPRHPDSAHRLLLLRVTASAG